MSVTLSPNMNLPVPGVGTEPGPQYATDVNNSLTIIDQHNHSSGSGVQITPSGLNINADLPFNGNNATLLRTVNFQSQASPLAGASPDLGCVYVSGADLYYNDGAGNQVRITQGGSVTGSAGTITGLPSGTASASFAAGVFTFQAATNTPANINMGSAVLGNNNTNGFALTLSPPTLGANYALVLPTIPAQTNVMSLDSSGNMGSITYDAVGQAMTLVGANAIAASMVDPSFGGTYARVAGNSVIISDFDTSITIKMLRGAVDSTGTILRGGGYIVTKGSSGVYNIFPANAGYNFGTNPIVTANVLSSGGGAYTCVVDNVAVDQFTITTCLNGTLTDLSFNFIALG